MHIITKEISIRTAEPWAHATAFLFSVIFFAIREKITYEKNDHPPALSENYQL